MVRDEPGDEPGVPPGRRDRGGPPPPRADPGGIDLRLLNPAISYFALDSRDPTAIVVGFIAPGFNLPSDLSGLELEALSLGVLKNASAFWVNLHPDEPDRMFDSSLRFPGHLIRALLESDLQLKKDLAKITDPRTPTGRDYWRQLESLAGSAGAMSASSRVWVVPGKSRIHVWRGRYYVAAAQLDVMLESTRLNRTSRKSDPRLRASERVASELLLPRLRELVNEAPQYAALRASYRSLLLAQAFRRNTPKIDPGRWKDLLAISRETSWQPKQVWNAYTDSLAEGEYRVSRKEFRRRGAATEVVTRTYFSGGVDFTDILGSSVVDVVHAPPPPERLAELALSAGFVPVSLGSQTSLRTVSIHTGAPEQARLNASTSGDEQRCELKWRYSRWLWFGGVVLLVAGLSSLTSPPSKL